MGRTKETAPDLENILNELGGLMTNDVMVGLTYAIDVDGKAPVDVAKKFIISKKLING